eukprot:1173827-Amphidinium_carterae.2
MEKILRAAGLPNDVLQYTGGGRDLSLAAAIGPSAIDAASLSTSFNSQVEADLLFEIRSCRRQGSNSAAERTRLDMDNHMWTTKGAVRGRKVWT